MEVHGCGRGSVGVEAKASGGHVRAAWAWEGREGVVMMRTREEEKGGATDMNGRWERKEMKAEGNHDKYGESGSRM